MPGGRVRRVRVTAKADYAVRALLVLAGAAQGDGGPRKGDAIAAAQHVPFKYLENILGQLRTAGLVRSQRGGDGGYWLAKDPATVSIADVIRAVEGPLATVRGERAEDLEYPEGSGGLQQMWVAVRASLRSVLETTTLADVVEGSLPDHVRALAADPDAWEAH
jgi:Rrf2 family protein